jgi:hypothetical protein
MFQSIEKLAKFHMSRSSNVFLFTAARQRSKRNYTTKDSLCSAIRKSESVIIVQREFRKQFQSDPPCKTNILRWYRQLHDNRFQVIINIITVI